MNARDVAQPGSALRSGRRGRPDSDRDHPDTRATKGITNFENASTSSVLYIKTRDVAQPGSALRSGRRGRWFESSHPDFLLVRPNVRGSHPDNAHRSFCIGGHLHGIRSRYY